MLPDLFRRVKPLYGKRIDDLWIAYQLGTPADKQSIEEVLTILAVKRLGIAIGEEKIVLEPPRPNIIGGGEYTVGTVSYPGLPPYPFTIPRRDLLRHVFVLGPSGTGKSTLIIGLLRQFLRDGLCFWSVDFKRNYRCLLHDTNADGLLVLTVGRKTSPLRVNMLQPPRGVERNEWVEALADTMSAAYLLMQGARNVLKEALLSAITIPGGRLRDALDHLKAQLVSARPGSRRYGWLESSYRTIEELTKGTLGEALNATDGVTLDELLDLPVVFELQGLGEDQKRCFCLYLLQAVLLLRKHQTDEREVLRHVLVFDEAHNVFPKDQWGELERLVRLAREVREYGEAIIAATQQADVADSLIANSGTKLILRTDYPKDVEFASKLLQIDVRWLSKIPLGQGIARLPSRYYQPFLFSFAEQPLKNQRVPDTLVRERYAQWLIRACFTGPTMHNTLGELNDRAKKTLGGKVPLDVVLALDAITTRRAVAPEPQAPRADGVVTLGDRQRALLADIAHHPISAVTERYTRLGWNPKTGHQIKKQLVKNGLLTVEMLPVLQSRVTLLALTTTGMQALQDLGVTVQWREHGGLEHEFWRHRVKERCEARGWTVTEEYGIGDGKRVDLCAQRNHQRLYIEIETGKSDIMANITKCQKHNATLIIFCTTTKTQQEYRKRVPSDLLLLSPEELDTLHRLLNSPSGFTNERPPPHG